MPNGQIGVYFVRTVGGVRPVGSKVCSGPCNVISGNAMAGVASSGKVEGNFIGTDLAGTNAIPNGDYWNTADGKAEIASSIANDGASLDSSAAVEISTLGGPSAAATGVCDQACNLISGNDESAVQLVGDGGNAVEGNIIGDTSTGAPLPNHGPGIVITHADASSTVGGDGDLGNLIIDNLGGAIVLPNVAPHVTAPVAPTVEGNSITGNANGIVYAPGTVAPVAPSMLPLTRAAGGGVTLSGNLPSFLAETAKTQTPARVDVYASPACGSQRQGRSARTATVLLTGHWTFTASGIASSLTDFMTTVTIDRSTSVYSACVH